MKRNKDFIKNTIILFVGKFSSQFMTLLLIPLFTHYLSTKDYGTVDLIQTYISLAIPVLSLRIDSAIFRFLIDSRNNKKEMSSIITNSVFVTVLGIIFTLCLGVIIFLLFDIKYSEFAIINIIALLISSVLMQMLRGLGKTKEYSISCIIIGVTTLIINCMMIIIFDIGAESILLSSTIANIAGIIYILICNNTLKYINIKKISKSKIKSLLKYSIPMIPDYLSGWIINVSDRTIISIIMGTAMNGIYTVSCKFSNILNSIFSIVNMSWQETASVHINDKDRDIYFSDMINNMIKIFSTIGISMLVIIPLIFNILIGKNYTNAYNYMPILIYANTWRVLVGVTNGIYIALKKTKEVAYTTVISAIINIIINILLIRKIGLYAAALSTLIAYLFMGLYRYFDCKKYIKIKLNYMYLLQFSIIFGVSTLIYLYNNPVLNLLNVILVITFSIVTNINTIKFITNYLKRSIRKDEKR